ncbi:MAG: REP-associated tyrosine transposase [Bacteroidota bacterium]
MKDYSRFTGLRYNIRTEKTYFLTCTVIDHVDVFTRSNHKFLLVDSLKYCQQNKGLEIFAWCLMSNHLHMIVNCRQGYKLSDTIRDFKKFTSKKLVEQIMFQPESRREWMLNRFYYAGKYNKKIRDYKFWQDGNHAIEVYSPEVTWQKINYIHQNPVRAMIVEKEEDYLFSSARNYKGENGLLDVEIISPVLQKIKSITKLS